MALTHRLFGIRSCNECHRNKRCIAPCVRTICSPEDYRVAVEHTQMFLEGCNDALVATLRDRMPMPRRPSGSSKPRSCEMRSARSTRSGRASKMSSAEFGDRDAFGLKVGPAGASVQVFEVRHGRVVERIDRDRQRPGRELAPGVPRAGRAAGGRPTVLRGPRAAARDSCRSTSPSPRCSRNGCRPGPAAASG